MVLRIFFTVEGPEGPEGPARYSRCMHRLCEVGPSGRVADQHEVLNAQHMHLDGSFATSLPVDIVPC